MSRIRPERIAALVAVFVGAYLGLFALALWSGALVWTERALCAGALRTMSAFGDPAIVRRVDVSRMGAYVRYDFTVSTPQGRQRTAAKHAFHAQNLVLFAALVLASPALSARRRAGTLAAGLAIIFALDTLIVVGDMLTIEDGAFQLGEQNVWPSLKRLGAALRYGQPTGGAFMVPVFVWGLLLGTSLLRRRSEAARRSAA